MLPAGWRWCCQKPSSCCWQWASICPTGSLALCTSSCCSACVLAGLLYLYGLTVHVERTAEHQCMSREWSLDDVSTATVPSRQLNVKLSWNLLPMFSMVTPIILFACSWTALWATQDRKKKVVSSDVQKLQLMNDVMPVGQARADVILVTILVCRRTTELLQLCKMQLPLLHHMSSLPSPQHNTLLPLHCVLWSQVSRCFALPFLI